MAQLFTPTIPMCGPEHKPEHVHVKGDVPLQLQKALNAKMAVIDKNCLRQNAEVVIRLFETICSEHVVKLQMQTRIMRRLIQSNPDAAPSSGPSLVPEGGLARSSLLGQDPCGDEELPEPDQSEPEKDPPSGDEADGSESSGSKRKKKRSSLQLLQIEVQNKTYLYLIVHVHLLISEGLSLRIKGKEREYAKDVDQIRTKSARNRMPWKVYKSIILMSLKKGNGWHFLCQLVGLHRMPAEDKKNWLHRIGVGRDWSKDFNIELPDSIYVNLALRYMTPQERMLTVEMYMIRAIKDGDANNMRAEIANEEIEGLSWENLRDLSEDCIATHGKYKPRKRMDQERMYTLEEAKELFAVPAKPAKLKRSTTMGKTATNKSQTAKCDICAGMGLKGRQIAHRTQDCDPRIRKRNVEKMKRKAANAQKPKAASRNQSAKKRQRSPPSTINRPECDNCKAAGRKYWRERKCTRRHPGVCGLHGSERVDNQTTSTIHGSHRRNKKGLWTHLLFHSGRLVL